MPRTVLHVKCPHCGVFDAVELADDLESLPTDREVQVRQAEAARNQVVTECYLEVRCDRRPVDDEVGGCGAFYIVDLQVRERPRIAVDADSELRRLAQEGKKLAVQIRRYKRTIRETPPPVCCPGCGRDYGEMAGYPAPLPTEGLCGVCSQELKRQLAVRAQRRGRR